MGGIGLLAPVVSVGLLLVVSLLAVGPLYLDTLERLAFSRTLTGMGNNLHPQVWTSFTPFAPDDYLAARKQIRDAAEGVLGDSVAGYGVYASTSFMGTVLLDPPGFSALTAFQYRSDYEEHVDIVAGRLPGPAVDGPLEVAIGESAARSLRLTVGQTMRMETRLPPPTPSFDAVLVGIVAPRDLTDSYWVGQGASFFETALIGNRPLLRLFLPEETLLGRLGTEAPAALGTVNDIIYMDETMLLEMGPMAIDQALLDLEGRLASSAPGATFIAGLDGAVERFRRQASLTRIPLVIVLALVETIAFYALIMIGLTLSERQQDSVALLRSRGARLTGTMLIILLWAMIVAGVALLIAPFLAASIVVLLGYTPGWQAVLDAGLLSPAPLLPTVPWVVAGALAATALLILPSTFVARTPLALLRGRRSRAGGPLWFQRLFLDVGLLLLAGAVLWQLQQRGGIVVSSESLEASIDRTALVVPVLAVLVAVLVFYRFLPVAVRLGAAATRRLSWLSPALAMERMARSPSPALALGGLFLLIATLGAFVATFGGTLDRSADDLAAYAAGGDARVVRLRGYESSGFDEIRRRYLDVEGITEASAVYRTQAGIGSLQIGTLVPLLAVDPTSVGGVLSLQANYAEEALPDLLARLALSDQAIVSPRVAPEGTQSIGIWARPEFDKGNRFLWLHLIDGTGKRHTYSMGPLDFTDWRFIEVPLARTTQPAPPGPYTIDSILVFETAQGATGSPGSLLLDDLQVRDAAGVLNLLDSFDRPSDWLPVLVTGERRDIVEAARGGSSERGDVLRFEWGRETRDGVRGIYVSPGARLVPILASPDLLAVTGLAVGRERSLHIASRLVPVRVVGVIDQFPTVKRGSAGFIVADGPSLLGHLNAVNVGRDVWPNETFLDFSDDPLAREAALAAIESNDTLSGEIIDQQELRDQSRRSPLASAGWRGLTVLAVVASIVALLLGVTAHGIAAAQERTLDMAVLRALGFARRRALHSLLIEYLVIAGLAIPAGVALGLWLSRIMVPLFLNLGADPVAPDLVLALDWRIFVGVISVVVVGALAVALALWRTYVSLNVANVLRAGQD